MTLFINAHASSVGLWCAQWHTDLRGGLRCCRLYSGSPPRWARLTPAWLRCSPSPPLQLLSSSALSITGTPGDRWGRRCTVRSRTSLKLFWTPPPTQIAERPPDGWCLGKSCEEHLWGERGSCEHYNRTSLSHGEEVDQWKGDIPWTAACEALIFIIN